MPDNTAEKSNGQLNYERVQADLNNLVGQNRELRIRFLEERITGLSAQIQLGEVLKQQAVDELTALKG